MVVARRRLVRGRAHSRFPNRRGLALTTGLRAPEASLLGRDVDVDAVGAAGGVRSAESPCAGFRRLRNDDHVMLSLYDPNVFTDRKRVLCGKRWSVRVDLGGRR